MGEETRDSYYQRVREDIVSLLGEACLSSSFIQAIELALAAEGKVFSPSPRSRWPLMPILSCAGAGGSWATSLPVATAAELVGISTDVFDEIEDGDECPLAASLGIPLATNAAFTLLAMAARSLCRAPAHVAQHVWAAIVTAADGQHQDLARHPFETPDEYLAMVDRKSAGLVAAFCRAGAEMARSSPEVVDGFGQFGLHMGRSAQLLNDLHDVWPGGRGKSDLARGIITLPAIFVMRGPDSPHRDILQRWLAEDGTPSELGESSVREALWAGGGIHYSWLVAETNRGLAEAALRSVCSTGVDAILELLLPPTPPAEKLLGGTSP